MLRIIKYAFVCTIAFAWIGGVAAQTKDPPMTSDQATAILDELRQIRQLLEKLTSNVAVKAKLRLDGEYSLGKKDAPLTMVEFVDYQCGYCRQFEATTFTEIRKKYIDTGKLRFISLNLPLNIHAEAMQAAEAVLCAGDQGEFWTMRKALFSNFENLSQNDIVGYAQRLHIDLSLFQSCLQDRKHKSEIQKHLQQAEALKVTGTPTFLVGKTTPEGVEGDIVVGSQPLSVFEDKLKNLGAPQ
ncbi:MAG TPA: thioredoxin domain-containing protein [Candidatus Dormibacteraeota bacterium]|nr:thioredoxin domain-containing protein [Candidatus Dormibacteraeota bacterium]